MIVLGAALDQCMHFVLMRYQRLLIDTLSSINIIAAGSGKGKVSAVCVNLLVGANLKFKIA